MGQLNIGDRQSDEAGMEVGICLLSHFSESSLTSSRSSLERLADVEDPAMSCGISTNIIAASFGADT